MSLSDAAPTVRAENDPQQLCFTFADRHWRVRGLETQLSCERLRVNLMVSRRELVYVDTLDLYTARQRRMFVNQAAAELYVEEATVKQDLGRVLLELETRQDALIREALAQKEPDVPAMSEQEQREAMGLLEDPQLLERILEDFDTCGLVGEETNSWSVTWPACPDTYRALWPSWCKVAQLPGNPRWWKPLSASCHLNRNIASRP
jgi:hypothetical protein